MLFLPVALICLIGRSTAQSVRSPEFDILLSTLLDRNAPLVDVDELSERELPIMLDARERSEYAVSHIPGAVWVGFDDFDPGRVKHISKDDEIVVYCSVGYRSEKVADRLRMAGYRNVRNLYGGVFEWVNAGLPVMDRNGPTRNIHGYDRVWSFWITQGEIVH